ncbi:potassium-transporting ATPase subunit F [Parafrankia colletiae]
MFRAAGACFAGGRAAVTAENVAGLILAIGLGIFVIAALLFPERF